MCMLSGYYTKELATGHSEQETWDATCWPCVVPRQHSASFGATHKTTTAAFPMGVVCPLIVPIFLPETTIYPSTSKGSWVDSLTPVTTLRSLAEDFFDTGYRNGSHGTTCASISVVLM
ncbi:hypothetical protein AVEN_166136-1 [Araneus ventricosus]|uniref:Uncharacterized protein n=1 Tax=Araneus ventricosus TaxID=182803 RepID=A0A4Y2KLS0_ARAVE|nr:hypothetical protein AVEN_166136-1 [Araneus ventricosus]